MENLTCQIIQGFRLRDDEAGFCFAKNQEGISRFNSKKLPGFFRDDNLPTVTDFCGTEYTLGIAFTKYVFASGHLTTSLYSYFSYFSHRMIITKSAPVVNTGAEKLGLNYL